MRQKKEKEQILETIRRKHGIAIDKNDPLFAMLTANEIILERQLKHQNSIFAEQLIEMEMLTNKYNTQSKEILEKQLTHIIQEAKREFKDTPKNKEITKERRVKSITYPILFIVTGIIIGYSTALLIL